VLIVDPDEAAEKLLRGTKEEEGEVD